MSRTNFVNGGAFARSARGSGATAVTAGGTGDATEVNGLWQSRLGDKGIALSAKIIVSFTATLAAGETLTFAGNLQDALDGAGAGAQDYGALVAATVVATGDSGGSTETGTFEIDVDLSGAREFVRAQITPNLSRANTDTANYHIDYVFFGDHRQPITKSLVNIGSVDAI